MQKLGLNDNRITREAGISNGLIGKARKRGSLSQENISKILLTYRILNGDWLLTGEGKMLREQHSDIQTNVLAYKDLADAREKIILLQEEQIDYLKREIVNLKESS
ncbi:hypothetical protein M8998_03635 [Sphingobacterium sp. lm-10]|uniref:hypothetical protein n=1 Tax=Sphingobacterium sp. lm-10 TaxID=2944904 RepID=UPI002020AF96|nr:hypothetical protein [Sphingobacterium sp. lm-10]MCL7987030.1 hypothetical protein [Sphingobacterium sp. lm-10]